MSELKTFDGQRIYWAVEQVERVAGDTERRLVFKNPKIRIGQGRPEWGAEPGKQYFAITWEE